MSALIGLLLASAILLVVAGLGLYNLSRCRTELAQLQARHADEPARFRTELVQLQARHAEWTAAEAHLELLRKEALQVREGIQSAIRANHENEKKRRASFDAEEASKKLDLDLKR